MNEFNRFMEVMRRVKTECPWDQKQTHETLRQYFIEETFEVVDAIDNKDDENLCEELGDILCQVGFHSLLAEDRDKFNIDDVFRTVSEKLIRRHPHVFGDTKVNNEHDVLKNWEQIKMKEGKKKSVLEGVPNHLPALIKAYRIQSKAGRVGFDWEDNTEVFNKLDEEMEELREAVDSGDKDHIEDELGDLLFSIVNLARKLEVNPEDALRRTIRKFDTRFKYIEKSLSDNGKEIRETSLEEMDRLWDEAKSRVEEK